MAEEKGGKEMNVNMSYVDLIEKPKSEAPKKEGKTEEGIAGFKNLLKDKSQKKSTGSDNTKPEAKNNGEEAGVQYIGNNTANNKVVENDVPVQEQKLPEEFLQSIFSPVIFQGNKNSLELSGKINPAQLLKSLNPSEQSEKVEGPITVANEFENLISDESKKQTNEVLPKGPGLALMGKKSEHTEAIVPEKNQMVLEGPGAVKKETLTGPGFAEAIKESVGPAFSKNEKTETKEVKEEDGITLKAFENLHSRNPEPVHAIRGQEDKPITMPVNENNPEELEDRLSKQILSQIKTGKDSMELQLEPHNLGKILLKVSYENNQVHVSIVCSESKTLKLISQSATEIGNILEANVERPFQVVVDKSEVDYLNNHNQDQQDGRQEQQHQQQNQKQSDDGVDDFAQKLRLGMFGSYSGEFKEAE
jgi:flagellar hook-length control protein FliK